jgi:hypothetical protein
MYNQFINSRTLIIFSVFLFAFVTVSAQTSVVAAPSKSRPAVALLKLNINGQFAQLTDQPILRNGQSMIQVGVLRSLQMNATWKNQTKTVTISKGSNTLTMVIGEQNTFIQNDKVFVPVRSLRLFSELIVEYEAIRNIVFLSDRSYKPDMAVLNQGNLVDARRAVISLPINRGSFKPWQGVLLSVFLVKENKQIVKQYEQHIQSIANELRID